MSKLPKEFYLGDNVIEISKALLGKFLFTNIGDRITGGMIVETEAYAGIIDKASHAWNKRQTDRTRIMYSEGGLAYVYFIYGMYDMFNILTNIEGTPEAILIRAIEPTEGIDIMLMRRKMEKPERKLTAGPGVLCRALGITRELNGADLTGDHVWLEDRGINYSDQDIIASPRVNIAYAEEHAELPWRFRVRGSKWTSPAK